MGATAGPAQVTYRTSQPCVANLVPVPAKSWGCHGKVEELVVGWQGTGAAPQGQQQLHWMSHGSDGAAML